MYSGFVHGLKKYEMGHQDSYTAKFLVTNVAPIGASEFVQVSSVYGLG